VRNSCSFPGAHSVRVTTGILPSQANAAVASEAIGFRPLYFPADFALAMPSRWVSLTRQIALPSAIEDMESI
jgi:hypothetical protein